MPRLARRGRCSHAAKLYTTLDTMPDSADFHNDRSNCLSVLRCQLHVTHNIAGTTPDSKCVHVTTDVRFSADSCWSSAVDQSGTRKPLRSGAGPLQGPWTVPTVPTPSLRRWSPGAVGGDGGGRGSSSRGDGACPGPGPRGRPAAA